MEPGLELDALIAEKVMGSPSPSEPGIDQAEYERRRKRWHPAYSTDIAAAWEVFEKLGDAMIERDETTERVHWKVVVGGIETFGETAPHAICLAALKTVGA